MQNKSLVDDAVVREKLPKTSRNHSVEEDVQQDLQYQDELAKERCKNSI